MAVAPEAIFRSGDLIKALKECPEEVARRAAASRWYFSALLLAKEKSGTPSGGSVHMRTREYYETSRSREHQAIARRLREAGNERGKAEYDIDGSFDSKSASRLRRMVITLHEMLGEPISESDT